MMPSEYTAPRFTTSQHATPRAADTGFGSYDQRAGAPGTWCVALQRGRLDEVARWDQVLSNGERLMFAGDAIFPVSFDHPEWHNGFEHDPEEAIRVRLRLMRELAATGAWLVATHMPFPSVGRVAAAGSSRRW